MEGVERETEAGKSSESSEGCFVIVSFRSLRRQPQLQTLVRQERPFYTENKFFFSNLEGCLTSTWVSESDTARCCCCFEGQNCSALA